MRLLAIASATRSRVKIKQMTYILKIANQGRQALERKKGKRSVGRAQSIRKPEQNVRLVSEFDPVHLVKRASG